MNVMRKPIKKVDSGVSRYAISNLLSKLIRKLDIIFIKENFNKKRTLQ